MREMSSTILALGTAEDKSIDKNDKRYCRHVRVSREENRSMLRNQKSEN
jgi:hypothetical protein